VSSGVAKGGGVGQGGRIGQRSSQRSSCVLGDHWSSHGSNHWSGGDSIVVPGDHLAAGGGHDWSRGSVGQGSRVGQGSSVGQRSTQETGLGSNAGNDGQDDNSLRINNI